MKSGTRKGKLPWALGIQNVNQAPDFLEYFEQ